MAGTIVFNAIYINAQETNGAVFIGETVANGWDSHNKNQMSIGKLFGAYFNSENIFGNWNVLSDNDVIDTYIQDGLENKAAPSTQI